MKRAIGLFLLLPAAAWAETAPLASDASASPQPPKPLFCVINYPAKAVRAGMMGTITVLLEVTAAGKPKDIIVASTSGSEILDSTTVDCAKTWRFHPAMVDGKAVEAPYSTTVEWMLNTSAWRISQVLREPLARCLSSAEAASLPLGGITTVGYQVKDGEVQSAVVERSSGHVELDQKAVACVSAWHFKPQTEDPVILVTGITMDVVMRNGVSNLDSLRGDSPKIERSPDSLKPLPVTGRFHARFDWSDFDAD